MDIETKNLIAMRLSKDIADLLEQYANEFNCDFVNTAFEFDIVGDDEEYPEIVDDNPPPMAS